jgi:hypothetical protein
MRIIRYISVGLFLIFLVFVTLFIREKNLEAQRIDQFIEQASKEDAPIPTTLNDNTTISTDKKVMIYEIVAASSLIISIIMFIISFNRKRIKT